MERPGDLACCTLIHVDDHGMWQAWFAGPGLDIALPDQQMVPEDRHFQLGSTINGLGVALFADWRVAEDMASGALVSAFGHLVPTACAWHLIHPGQSQLSATARTVHDCIIRMAWSDTLRRPAPTSTAGAPGPSVSRNAGS